MNMNNNGNKTSMGDTHDQNDFASDGELNDSLRDAIPADAVAEAKAEAERCRNDNLYLRAEFDNYKKQMIKESSEQRKYGSQRLAVDLLNVLDIFDTALTTENSPENSATFRKGIEMTASELRNTLQRHGIEEIPAQGRVFDPSQHEALTSQETNDVASGTITQVFKKPYKLYDRIIRPGQVVVAKPKAE